MCAQINNGYLLIFRSTVWDKDLSPEQMQQVAFTPLQLGERPGSDFSGLASYWTLKRAEARMPCSIER